MQPLIGLLTPHKEALGRWLVDFHAQFQPDTPQNAEWAQRESQKAIIIGKGGQDVGADLGGFGLGGGGFSHGLLLKFFIGRGRE